MRSRAGFRLIATLCVGSCLAPWSGHSATPEETATEVQAVWRPVEIRYSYAGFTTAYNCDSYEDKVERILAKLGAAPEAKVKANGCRSLNQPSKNFLVTITLAAPVPAINAPIVKNPAQQELLKRLGSKNALPTEPFPARWQTVNLARDRSLDLSPGDCELMEGLRDHVLPKLAVKVVSETIRCTPHQLSLQPPGLTVSALVPADADTVSAEKSAEQE